jgi:hypothetical protein
MQEYMKELEDDLQEEKELNTWLSVKIEKLENDEWKKTELIRRMNIDIAMLNDEINILHKKLIPILKCWHCAKELKNMQLRYSGGLCDGCFYEMQGINEDKGEELSEGEEDSEGEDEDEDQGNEDNSIEAFYGKMK